jgi:hypothetical protein
MSDWQEKALELRGTMGSRAIGKLLGKGKSTINDLFNKVDKELINTSVKPDDIDREQKRSYMSGKKLPYYKIETSLNVRADVTHLMIPDTQCKPDIDLRYLDWLGQYIVDKKPEVIVHIGDHADMESLSSYDKGQRSAEGKRVHKDIDSAIEGMNRLLKPLFDLQQQERDTYGYVKYKPKMVITLGNHEQRIERHVNANPELHGFLSYGSLKYKEMGWEVYDYLQPVLINGVTYVHFMANPMTGKPYGGTALNILKNVGESFCMGHKQCLDIATRFLPSSGKQQWAIIAGAYYEHDEGYKGYQGNHHWRGIVVQHNVKDGSFNPMLVSLDYLKGRYGKS